MLQSTESPYYAAIDLGSNSFHMLIARIQNGQLDIIDREKEMVQIARGVTKYGNLSQSAQNRALECLNRFSERLRDIPTSQIRAVGTKTLRSTSHSGSFLKKAQQALGVPIQIISGYEEARLVYSGLSHGVSNDDNRRLVIDIGGGSTEFIIGEGHKPLLLESLSIGCVSYTKRFSGKQCEHFSLQFFDAVYLNACTEIEVLRKNFLKAGWDIVYGTSGTVRAIADLSMDKDGGALISRIALDQLVKTMIGNPQSLAQVPELRRDILPAGLAILKAVFDQLQIESMHVGDVALKEGLLFDTIGRLSNHDSRQETIEKLQIQYLVDIDHADRVATTAVNLWQQVGGPALPGVSRTKILRWAAQLHEIGLSISHSGFHHHGYYILRHNDMAGFGRYEQYILANLVRSHRKGLDKGNFFDMDEAAIAAFVPLLLCLRISALLHRRREGLDAIPNFAGGPEIYQLIFQPGWLAAHPLTLAGLEQEQEQLKNLALDLEFS